MEREVTKALNEETGKLTLVSRQNRNSGNLKIRDPIQLNFYRYGY